MKKALLAILLTFMIGCKHAPTIKPATEVVENSIETQHKNTHEVWVFDALESDSPVGHCSGTVVGPNAILTAQHCFHDSNVLRLDKDKTNIHIMAALVDGNDHVIYIVDKDFATWSQINERDVVKGEPVHQWGAPERLSDVFRIGYFEASDYRLKDPDNPTDKGKLVQVYILPVYHGDSGSAIFDANGQIIGVVSMSQGAEEWSLPLEFTQGQLDIVTP